MSTRIPTPICDADDGTRAALRRALLARREELDDRAGRSAALERALWLALGRLRPRSIGAYCAIRGEFDPLPLLQALLAEQPGLLLALPRVEASSRSMEFAAWHPGDPMRIGAYGIAEPRPQAPRVEPELLLLPCVGFDASGLRLGYGGGYYDRYLARHGQVRTIGLAFEACRADAQLRAQPHDRLLDLILTESASYGPGRAASEPSNASAAP